MLIEKRARPIIEQIGSNQWGLALVKFTECELGVGVKEGPLIDAPDAFVGADIPCIQPGHSLSNFAVSFLVSFGFFQCPELALT